MIGAVCLSNATSAVSLRPVNARIPARSTVPFLTGVANLPARCLRARNTATSSSVAVKRSLAFFPDEPRLFDYLTVRQHLNFVARVYGVAHHEALALPLLEELELATKADQLPGELSRGMKQKLAIACGLLHGPRVMFFDEPLTGLDPLGIRRMNYETTACVGLVVDLADPAATRLPEPADTCVVIEKIELPRLSMPPGGDALAMIAAWLGTQAAD